VSTPLTVNMPRDLLAGVELGGTKCICILGTGPDRILAQRQIPTREPAETLDRVAETLASWHTEYGSFCALGIASFGPLEAQDHWRKSGRIAATAKPGWSGTDVAGRLGAGLDVPVGFATDVEGAALAEGRWGGARGLDDYAYITVGTGVGVSLIVAGHSAGGFGHSELGHIRVVQRAGEQWSGICPFHGSCIEGLISGPAIAARTGVPAEQLPADHPVWESLAFTLGQLMHILVLATAPRRILIGGGVFQSRDYLFEHIRQTLHSSLGGYRHATELDDLKRYVAPPELGGLAGPLGALALAADAAAAHRHLP